MVRNAPVLLITPPFTQLNTPYPATAYLKGFLATRGLHAVQADLAIEVTLALFNSVSLAQVFSRIEAGTEWSANAGRILRLKADYLRSIDAVILFLQGKNP